jgi:PAS domain S-box-containing protein
MMPAAPRQDLFSAMLDGPADGTSTGDPLPAPAEGLRREALVRQAFFGAAAAGCGIAALLVALTGPAAGERRLEAALLFGALALAALLGLRVPAQGLRRAMTGLLLAVVAAAAWTAWRLGTGLAAPGLWSLPLLVCVLSVAAGWRAGAVLSAAASLAIVAVHALQPAASAPSGPQALGMLLLLVALGLVCGVTTFAVLTRHLGRAADSEQRFRGLLAVAVEAYWEIDPRHRIVALQGRRGEAHVDLAPAAHGVPAWDLPRLQCDPDTLDRLMADLDARVPFRDVPVRWRGRHGGADRLLLISGEPRHDREGVFRGFWGVARDVTGSEAARAALAATENRYRELFARSPGPLVLHRQGRVLDANPAALAMFGCSSLAELRGQDLLQMHEAGDSRERARHDLDLLQERPPGTALPVTELRLVVRGQTRWVRATAVRLGDEADEESARGAGTVLSIYMDITERRTAEEAVRRSEALLSQLVATSPEVITLTDLHTQRLAMVNQAFERLTGLSRDDAVGRTALELGLYAHPADRDRLLAEMQARGKVSDLPLTLRTRQGEERLMLACGARFNMDGRQYMVVNARDVTERERVRMEREAILTNASVGIAVTRDRRFVLANPAFEQIFGYPPGALVGREGRVVWHSDADYAEIGARAGGPLAAGEPFEIERPMRRADGSGFLARLRARAIDPQQPSLAGTVWIVEDVTDRRDFERRLAQARDAAEAASRAKSAFLANTSHELRTPLNAIVNASELALEAPAPQARRYVQQVAESARSLSGIISDILDLSKIEAGKLLVESRPFDLGELMRAVERSHALQARAAGLDLGVELAPELQGTLVRGDATRVRQILGNFVGNALKFTPSGEVRLQGSRTPAGRVRLVVSDTGPGIAPQAVQRLFQRFSQADESITRRHGGTGLGLAICRELAHLMQGEVGVDSEPGRGSRFWVELPLPEVGRADPLPPPAGAADPPAATLQGARVLVVEDNPVNMMIAVAMLQRWGAAVEQATDGLQALQAVQRAADAGSPFDAVLMDVQMPVMSGHEAARALRDVEAGAHVPIIALTAAALVTEREQALAAGMDDFLTKPIDAERLHATLLRWIQPRPAVR